MPTLVLAALVAMIAANGAAADPAGATLVFFDWSKPGLSGDARATLDEVAAAHRRNPQTKVHLAGHGDRSGSAAANRRSALERARSVGAYLATRGVPASAMTFVSHGEERPLIATADGVREVQNRRVEISFGSDL